MKILVLNPGSSSIKFSLYEALAEDAPRSLAEGELSGIGGTAKLEFKGADERDLASGAGNVEASSIDEALATVERALEGAGLPGADAVGYRVVHPGPRLRRHQKVTPDVMNVLKAAARFAPLHDPVAVELIEETMRRMPGVPHFACFDTVFHEAMPETARMYALPAEVRAEGVRRYGFHGLSCESVVEELQERLGVTAPESFVVAHLGSGCSVTSVVKGQSVFTTMGLTPTGGVVMGTRPGDLDPGVMLYLLRRAGATVDSVEAMVNRESGLRALGGVNDMRELRRRAGEEADGAEDARLAIAVFCTSVARAIAAELVMIGAEAVVFTGGIGEHDAASRREITERLRSAGVQLDELRNGAGLEGEAVQRISAGRSRLAVYVAKADEDRMIAQIVQRMCSESEDAPAQRM